MRICRAISRRHVRRRSRAGDRLASWTGGSYTYNAAGCVTRIERAGRPSLDLTWNSQYQLVSVSTNGVFAESYAYDALGRRVATTTLDGTVRHVYDDNWQCLADIDGNGNVLCSYVWGEGIDSLLAVKVGGDAYYPLTDIQGTVWGYVDSANRIVARWMYDAWGNVLSEYCAVPTLASVRYRFQGREWSAATGLINFRMRWYDPVTGRWLSKDSIGLSGGMNPYVFCDGDPLSSIDPFGTMPFSEAMDIAGAAVEGFAEGFTKGLAAGIDGLLPFVDPFSEVYTDECGNIEDYMYLTSYWSGLITFEVITAAVGKKAWAALRAGKEIKIGKNLRIAPNGNRTGNKFGERPHYHRRGSNPDGSTRPGQGIGRHRPWESKSTDQSFWDRF